MRYSRPAVAGVSAQGQGWELIAVGVAWRGMLFAEHASLGTMGKLSLYLSGARPACLPRPELR